MSKKDGLYEEKPLAEWIAQKPEERELVGMRWQCLQEGQYVQRKNGFKMVAQGWKDLGGQ